MKRITVKNILDIFVLIICFISSIIILSINENENYSLIFIFPLLFLIIYITYFSKTFKENVTPFNVAFCLMLFFRYVIMSILIAIVGYSCGSKAAIHNKSNYVTAQFLMIIEIIAINIIMYFFNYKKKHNIIENKKIKILNRGNVVIVCFFLIVFSITIIYFNKIKDAIYFIYPTEESSIKYNSLNDFLQMILSLFNIAKQFFCLFIIIKCHKKYMKSKNSLYFMIATTFALANILIYTGTNRAGFIICTISTIYILGLLFEKYKKILIIVPIVVGVTILPLISSFRKSELINDNTDLYKISEEANAYLGGIDNVAIAIETSNQFNKKGDLLNASYDLFRGVLGVNFLIKSFNMELSSAYFNYVFFGHMKNVSQIIPIIGQGYFYFDIYGCWIIEIVFIMIAIKFEKKFLLTTNIYWKYFLLMILLRLAMIQGINGTILGNIISFDVFVPWVIIMLNNKFVIKKETRNSR